MASIRSNSSAQQAIQLGAPNDARAQQPLARCLVVSFGIFILLGLHPIAFAKTPAEQDYQRAQTLFQQGRQLTLKQQYTRALNRYTDAVLLLKNAERLAKSDKDKDRYRNTRAGMLYVIGRTYQLAKRPTKAYIAYTRCLNARPNARLQRFVRRFLRQLKPKIIARLKLTTIPTGAQAKITDPMDQVQRTTTPLEQEVIPGTIKIKLDYPGYQSQTLTLNVSPRGQLTRTITLQRIKVRVAPLPPPPKTSGATIGMWTSAAVAGVAGLIGISMLAIGIPQEQSGLTCYGQATKPECTSKTDTEIADAIEGGQTLKFAGIGMLVAGGAAAALAVVFSMQRPKGNPQNTTSSLQPNAKSIQLSLTR